MFDSIASSSGSGSELEGVPCGPLRSAIEDARDLAMAGAALAARRRFAEALGVWQEALARDPALLELAVATLLHARGFEMLRRLLVAVQGRTVRIALADSDLAMPDGALYVAAERDGGADWTISPRLFEAAGRERAVEALSRQLARLSPPDMPGGGFSPAVAVARPPRGGRPSRPASAGAAGGRSRYPPGGR
jgi:hypothetical protein